MGQQRPKTNPATRWLNRRDLPTVLAIEREAFAHPWSEEEFLKTLRSPTVVARVAELGGRVVGFAVSDMTKNGVEMIDLAVSRHYRRLGVGRALIEAAKKDLRNGRRDLRATVSEFSTDAIAFLSACGLRATCIRQDVFASGQPGRDLREDGYVFAYTDATLAEKKRKVRRDTPRS